MAYKKTILHDNSDLTLLEHWEFSCKTSDKKRREFELKEGTYWEYLFRSEIFLDYFKRETAMGKAHYGSFHRFKGKNNKAQVTLTNSLNNLRDKNLILLFEGMVVRGQGIQLTQKGIDTAQSLIINTQSKKS